MNRIHYTTVISNSYLYMFLVMYNSLLEHSNDFHIYVLCMNRDAYEILCAMQLKHATCISLEDFENQALKDIKHYRTNQEYAWTLKPSFLHHVMSKFSHAEVFTHVDADICFYSDPEKVFDENVKASLYICDHMHSSRFIDFYNTTGRYNSGFVGCKKDDIGCTAIEWLKNKAIEWCYNIQDTENKLYGEQRYLESWPSLFGDQLHIITSKGANAAPWNIDNYELSVHEKKLFLDEDELIFYHFSGMSILGAKEFNLAWFKGLPDHAVKLIYIPYADMLAQVIAQVEGQFPSFKHGFAAKETIPITNYYKVDE